MIPARFPDGTEIRAGVELRVAAGRRLEGYAALFDHPAVIGSFTETIRHGAFSGTLARSNSDVLALVDHDMTRLLARQKSGTLRLVEDGRGLAFDLDLPSTGLANDILEMTRRGDIGGMSFGFRTIADEWPAADRRELVTAELVEISIVHSFPAYSGTTVNARNRTLCDALALARQRRRFMDTL
jgi:hypothetical protein